MVVRRSNSSATNRKSSAHRADFELTENGSRFFSAVPRKSSDSSSMLSAARLTATTFVCGARMATPPTNSTRLWVCSQIIRPRTNSSAWFTSKRDEQTKPSLSYRESSICPAGCMASARSATSTPGWGGVATHKKCSYRSPRTLEELHFPTGWPLSTPDWARKKRPSTISRERTLNVLFRPHSSVSIAS